VRPRSVASVHRTGSQRNLGHHCPLASSRDLSRSLSSIYQNSVVLCEALTLQRPTAVNCPNMPTAQGRADRIRSPCPASRRKRSRPMLLTPRKAVKTAGTHVGTIGQVYGNPAIRYEALGRLCLFQRRWEGAAMMPNRHHVAHCRDDMRATGGESRRRAQRIRPRHGNTGAYIAQTERVFARRPIASPEGYDGIACPDKDTRRHGRS
jgi:hypothetical protein